MFNDTLKTVAHSLVNHCKNGTEEEGLNTLYSDNVVSVEAASMDGSGQTETHGLEALRAKHAWWNENTEVHSFSAEGPFLHGENQFGAVFRADVTMKPSGERWDMAEIAVYTLEDGKIIREEFFYTLGAD